MSAVRPRQHPPITPKPGPAPGFVFCMLALATGQYRFGTFQARDWRLWTCACWRNPWRRNSRYTPKTLSASAGAATNTVRLTRWDAGMARDARNILPNCWARIGIPTGTGASTLKTLRRQLESPKAPPASADLRIRFSGRAGTMVRCTKRLTCLPLRTRILIVAAQHCASGSCKESSNPLVQPRSI